jgi:hypothetical protein
MVSTDCRWRKLLPASARLFLAPIPTWSLPILALVVANLQLSATDLVAPVAASVDSDSIKNVPQRYVG